MVEIKVKRHEPALIVPENPTKNETLELSDIDDQQGVRVQGAVIMSFKRRSNSIKGEDDPAKVIKEALAKTLDYYYPFAGRVRETGHHRKLVVDCNGEGVLFIEADANVTLNDIQTQIIPPCPLLDDLLFDVPGSTGIIDCPLLLFQGGDKSHEVMNKDESNIIVPGGFLFGPEEIKAIRNHLPSHLQHSYSTFELLCACVWKCRVKALQPDPEDTVQVSMTVSVRENNIILLPSGYYGNSFVSPAITTKAKNLMMSENSLLYALKLVKQSRNRANEEYVRSMMDLMVMEGRPKYKDHLSWMATNLTRKGLEFVDFGWGKPVYSGVPRGTSLVSTFTRFKNGKGQDVIAVVLCLPNEVLLRFQNELGKFVGDFSPLISPTSKL
ncbi:hypothetical protein SOVF_090610 [Spinacia oleracea]|nr:hypothetical protein SOVF_090610 [Spinacia oleracea]